MHVKQLLQHDRLSICWLIGGTLLTAGLLAKGLWSTQVGLNEAMATDSRMSRAGVEAFKNIEDVRVGDRVAIAHNPVEPFDDSLGRSVEPKTWVKIDLEIRHSPETVSEVVLLRPEAWFNERLVRSDGTITLSLPEVGIDGTAHVTRVEPCQELASGEGAVVIGTFSHHAKETIQVHLEGVDEPIHCTPSHATWSQDRRAFVEAQEPQPGERVLGIDGPRRVLEITRQNRRARVFNLQIHGQSVYRVSTAGVLVHNVGINGSAPDQIMCFPPGTHVLMANGTAKPIETIERGEYVMADDPYDDIGPRAYQVIARHENYTLRLIDISFDSDGDGACDGVVKATGEHPFWTKTRGWINAQDLAYGDMLQQVNGSSVAVIDAVPRNTVSRTYNLSVDGVHSFFIAFGETSILVHNVDPWDILFSRPVGPNEVFQHGPWAGRPLQDAIDAARELGRLPDGLELGADLVNDQWVAANNRTLFVAQQANIPQVHPVRGPQVQQVIFDHFANNGVGGPIDPCP